MGFKEWSSWVKGGIIGILFLLLILLIYFSIGFYSDSTTICPGDINCYRPQLGESLHKLQLNIENIFTFPVVQIIGLLFDDCSADPECLIFNFIMIPLMIIQYFIIGALIGFIIEKIKSKT